MDIHLITLLKWAGLGLLVLLPVTLYFGTRFDFTSFWSPCHTCLNARWYKAFKANLGLMAVWCAFFLVRSLVI